MQLNINTDAVVKHTNTLEKMHKSALPVAIRGALNKAAFDVKKDTMPRSASRTFKNRQPNFFKANSKVEMAKGFDLRSMKATVGFTDKGLNGNNNFAVKDLEQQEDGGKIKGRSFIPTDIARGGNKSRPVRPGNRMGKISNLVNSAKARGKNRYEKFVKSAMHAGVGGYVIGNFQKAILWRINSIKRKRIKIRGRSSTTIIKATPIYSFSQKRSVRVKSTNFMKKASLESASKMEDFFISEAKRQIEKLNK